MRGTRWHRTKQSKVRVLPTSSSEQRDRLGFSACGLVVAGPPRLS